MAGEAPFSLCDHGSELRGMGPAAQCPALINAIKIIGQKVIDRHL